MLPGLPAAAGCSLAHLVHLILRPGPPLAGLTDKPHRPAIADVRSLCLRRFSVPDAYELVQDESLFDAAAVLSGEQELWLIQMPPSTVRSLTAWRRRDGLSAA